MKIAVSSLGPDKESQIDQRFGRCKYFALYDTENKEFTYIDNEAQSAAGGAGIQSAQTLSNSGVQIVLTGNVGPNAHQTLTAANITIITGVIGKVIEAIEKYERGEYSSTEKPTVPPHSGMQ